MGRVFYRSVWWYGILDTFSSNREHGPHGIMLQVLAQRLKAIFCLSARIHSHTSTRAGVDMVSKMNCILIIGGTSGIGEAFVRRFHDTGKKVVVAGRRAERLNVLADELPGLETVQVHLP